MFNNINSFSFFNFQALEIQQFPTMAQPISSNLNVFGDVQQATFSEFTPGGGMDQILGSAAIDLLGFTGEDNGPNSVNGSLTNGWALNIPLYNYSKIGALDNVFTNDSGLNDAVILDWNADGQATTVGKNDLSERVNFDVNGDGVVENTEWTKADAFLAYDANEDGKVNDGTELMNTTGVDGTQDKYTSGWEKASDLFDTNKDGVIMGDELNDVKIWVDANGDGITDTGELKTAKDAGISYIDANYGSALRAEQTDEIVFGAAEQLTANAFGSPFYAPSFTQVGATIGLGQPMTAYSFSGGQWGIPSEFWLNPNFQ